MRNIRVRVVLVLCMIVVSIADVLAVIHLNKITMREVIVLMIFIVLMLLLI